MSLLLLNACCGFADCKLAMVCTAGMPVLAVCSTQNV
jgi:hypothetical protein